MICRSQGALEKNKCYSERAMTPLTPQFSCFFGWLDFLVFLFFLDLIFNDFWAASSLRFAAPAMLCSWFSCFEKVIILDDFWPPKTSPKPLFFMFFDHPFFHVFLLFRSLNCWKTQIFACIRMVWWRYRVFNFFSFLSFFCVFRVRVFLGVWTSLFSILVGSGDLQNRPWPSKKHAFT